MVRVGMFSQSESLLKNTLAVSVWKSMGATALCRRPWLDFTNYL